MQAIDLKNILFQLNPWWGPMEGPAGVEAMVLREKHRFHLLERIFERTGERSKINVLIGPRQVGKTTLINQLIARLINERKASGRRILYISFDHPLFRLEGSSPLDTLFEIFRDQLGENWDRLSGPVYIFLDEIQKLPDWANAVKHWHERNYLIHFTVSGSSALQILKGSGESLLGRTRPEIIFPLSFKERLLWDLEWEPRGLLTPDFHTLKELNDRLPEERRASIQEALHDHLLWGGYPELWSHPDIREKQRLLNDYKTLTFERDLFSLENIRDTLALDGLFALIAQSNSTKINYSKYSNVLGIKNDSVKRYCGLFDSIFLVRLSYAFSKSKVVNLRKDKKIYLMDPGLRNAVLLVQSLDDQQKGLLAESLVAAHLTLLSFAYELSPKLFYWQEPRKGEVDFVWKYSDPPIPIEMKFQKNIKTEDKIPLLYFLKKFNLPKGVLVTRDLLHQEKTEGREILMIPLWLFLLIDQI